jgi:electron transfer flavoprotein alpha/beta subunit
MEIADDLNRVTATRALERGDREVIQCELPAVLSVQLAPNRPRYPMLQNVLRAKQQRIPKTRILLDETEHSRRKNRKLQTCIGFSLPKPRPRKVFSPDRQSSAADRIRQLMSGGSQKKETKIHTGQPENISDKCIEFLEKNGFLR